MPAAPAKSYLSLESAATGARIATTDLPLRCTFRETPESEPIAAEIIAKKAGGRLILRETGRPLVGVFAARRDQVAPPLDVDTRDFIGWLRVNLWHLGAL